MNTRTLTTTLTFRNARGNPVKVKHGALVEVVSETEDEVIVRWRGKRLTLAREDWDRQGPADLYGKFRFRR